MAQTGYTPISIYYSSTAAATPTAGNLVAGELAINTADGKLFYKDSAGVVQVIAGKGGAGVAGGSNTQVQYNSSGSLAGSSNFIFDGTNVGVGVTPNAWTLGKSVSVGDVGSAVFGFGGYNSLGSGSYFNSAWKYSSSSTSQKPALFVASDGGFSWSNAAAGTAGNNITFTQAMTLDSSGNLGIGTSSPTDNLYISRSTNAAGGISVVNTNNAQASQIAQLYLQGGDNAYAQIKLQANSVNSSIRGNSDGSLAFLSSTTERMRIASTGNVNIGATTTQSRLDISDNGRLLTAGAWASAVIGLKQTTGNVNDLSQLVYGYGNGSQTYGSAYMGFIETNQSGNGYGDLVFGTRSVNTDSQPTERMRITSAGDVGIGNTGSTSFKFNVTGTGTSSAAYALRAEDSGTNALLAARNDGFIITGTRAVSPYNNTTGSAANLYVGSDGGLARSTSSLKYKTDVQDATHGLEDLLKLRSVTYKQKNTDADGNPVNTVFGGLIAEEVDTAGLTEFVQYAEDGSPDALAYGNMVAICIKAIQELNAKVDAQALEIATLKAK